MDRRPLFSQRLRLRAAPVRLSRTPTTFAAARPAVSATELSRFSGLPTASPFLAAALRAALTAAAPRGAAARGRALARAFLTSALLGSAFRGPALHSPFSCTLLRAALRRAFRAGLSNAARARPRGAFRATAARLLRPGLHAAFGRTLCARALLTTSAPLASSLSAAFTSTLSTTLTGRAAALRTGFSSRSEERRVG